jgi:Kdo2-lipid IVA lauroyltransferase/acyltransferase
MGTLYLLLLRGFGWFYYFAPRWCRSIMAGVLGAFARRIGYRAAVVRQNLGYAYPGDAPEQVQYREALAHDFYRHLGRLGCEILMLFGPMRRYAATQGEYVGVENWERARAPGTGVILVAGHTGSWEVAAAMCAIEAQADVVLVSRRYKPEWLRRAIDAGRKRCGVDTAYEPRTMPEIIERLKRNGVVAIVLDQYIAPPVGVRVPFFGVPVGTNVSIALLAKRTGAQVLPFKNYRRPDGQVVVEAGPPVPWQSHDNPEVELAINTAAYSAIVEQQIREHPAQWLWSHRRFKGDLTPLHDHEWERGRRYRAAVDQPEDPS